MIAGLIAAIINIFYFLILVSSDIYRLTVVKMSHRLRFILLLRGFVIGIFSLLYTAIISAMPNSINTTDENKDTLSSHIVKYFFI